VGKRKAKHQAAQNLKKKLKRSKESDDSDSSAEDQGSGELLSFGLESEGPWVWMTPRLPQLRLDLEWNYVASASEWMW